MIVPVILFAVAAVGGLALAAMRFQNKDLPMPLALVHGGVAAAGLIALLLPVIGGHTGGKAKIALGLFVVAALGGFFLFSFHLRKKALPIGVMAVHALVAVAAFLILLVGVFVSA